MDLRQISRCYKGNISLNLSSNTIYNSDYRRDIHVTLYRLLPDKPFAMLRMTRSSTHNI